MKRTAIIAGVLIAVIAFSWLGYATLGQRGDNARETQGQQTVTVQRGDIAASVNATGSIEPEKQVSLNFQVPGRLIELPVQVGSLVEAGQVLAKLDTADLALQVTQAKASLRSSKARLRQLQAPPAESDLAAARIAVESAQAAYDNVRAGPSAADLAAAQAAYDAAVAAYQQLQAGPTAEDLAGAQATLDKAKAALHQAQSAYDQVATRPNAAMLPQALQLQQATIDYQAAKASFDRVAAGATEDQRKNAWAQVQQTRSQLQKLRQSPTPSALKAAEQQLAQAKAQRDKLQRGADEADLVAAQSQVDQAQAALDQAQTKLADATLRAPFKGVVASIGAKVYEQASGAAPVIVLVDDSRFHLDVSVDEVDVGQVSVGDTVSVTLDAFRDRGITGHIENVSPVPTIESGVVSYPVRIALDATELSLRAGMTANATITTEKHQGVLVVPNRAIQIDRETGQLFVEKSVNGLPKRVEISTGLRNETISEVVSGLEEGDVLVIRTISGRERLQQRMSD
ncbi:MAG: efflux RND transporter periplasmic adaptor subunit [Chloroflexi bacterium]|nr:efflux RND transporter periplasmic adaptor subunit [Chloroflexota bacterium]